jgi:aminomethyltransferase
MEVKMLQTSLYQVHVDFGARMVDFAGWQMPVIYKSILDEHAWTRQNIGLFDVSHMGRLELIGPTAGQTLDALCTRKMSDLPLNTTRYSLMCNAAGGVLDDLMVSKLAEDKYYVVCNAGNREKIVAHLQANLKPGTALNDLTLATAMIAVQGPKVLSLISKLIPGPIGEVPHRGVFRNKIMGIEILAFRGGYTGEDGFEVVLPPFFAPIAWAQLCAATLDDQPVIKPAGLGARDTLRLEAALPLYGHELNEQIDPISARLEVGVDFDHDYIGKSALEEIKRTGPKQVRVGLKLQSKRAARQGFKILQDGQEVGTVTSGAFTPTVNASIAMAYLRPDLAQIGNTVQVQIGTERQPAEVVKMPFYRRPK